MVEPRRVLGDLLRGSRRQDVRSTVPRGHVDFRLGFAASPDGQLSGLARS
jgi:hypothetical protein